MEEEFKQFIARMDEFAVRTDNRLGTLEEDVIRVQTTVENVETRLNDRISGLRLEIVRLNKSITQGSLHVESMLDDFATQQLALREDLEALRKRVEALEKRNPAA